MNQKYLFTRDGRSQKGFLSTNNAATDALNALSSWAAKNSNWKYKEIEDKAEEGMVAILSIPDEHATDAGVALDESCIEYGVVRSADLNESVQA